jgi:hypothetical protein
VASEKDFWLDEVYEFIDPLGISFNQIWNNGVHSPSAAPLYFTIQKVAIPLVLKSEARNNQGFDWRVSLRFVPAFSLALGAFFAFLILLDFNPLVAVGIPIFLGCYNFALYYGAETRIYGTWLGLAIAFYACSLRLSMQPKVWPWGILWCILCAFLTLTAISSPIVIGLVALALMLYFLRSYSRKTVAGILGSGLTVTVLIFFKFKSGGTPFVWQSVVDHYSYDFVTTEGLRMLEGLRKTLELLAMVFILIFAGIFGSKLPHRRYFLFSGILVLSQLIAVACVFILQSGTGYWYAPRHAIFVVAAQAVAASSLVLLSYEGLIFFLPKWRRPILVIVIIVAFLNWFNWRVLSIPKSYKAVSESYKPYCQGPVLLSPAVLAAETPLAVPVKRFNWLNIERHRLRCVRDENPYTYDFSPQWIYGR